MNSEHEMLETFEPLSQVKLTPMKRQEIWNELEVRIDTFEEERNSGKRKLRWGITFATVAGIAVTVGSVMEVTSIPTVLHPGNQLASNVGKYKPLKTILTLSQLAPAAFVDALPIYGQSSYASPDGKFAAIWKNGTSGITTWVEDMNGHEWFVAKGKYYIVGSTPSGGVLYSSHQIEQVLPATFPEFVNQPGQPGRSMIPKDSQARLTRYATQSVLGTWATIEVGSNNPSDYIGTWVDVNGQKIAGLGHAEEIAWSPDGSKLAALISVDATPKGLSRPWSVVQNAVLIYNLQTKQVSRSNEYGMSGLSWSPDGKLIAVDCGEETSTYNPGLYEFSADNLRDVQQFYGIRPTEWSWIGGHTALASQIAPKPFNLMEATWDLHTGNTNTAMISGTYGRIHSVREAGFERSIVQDDKGLLVITGSRMTRIVNQAVQTWWYDSATHEVYYVPSHTQQVWKITL